MKFAADVRRFAYALGIAIFFFSGCQTAPDTGGAGEKSLKVELAFLETDHRVRDCMKEWGDSFLELENGILYVERDSKLRVTPPRGTGIEPYHIHLVHRVAGVELDHAVHAGKDGTVELDLSRFDQPEKVVVTSSAFRVSEGSPGRTGKRPQEALLPPYALSFRLVPADQQFITSLQDFRYEIKTEFGTLGLFVQPLTRDGMMLTLVDGTKLLDMVIKETPYVYLRGEDGYCPPRLVVDVLDGRSGVVWERAGAWPVPQEARAGEKSFALRTPRRELIAFSPPPLLDLELPAEAPTTSARISAKVSGLREKEAVRFVLGATYPLAGPKADYAVRVQTHTLDAASPSGTYVADLSHLEGSAFPLNAALLHRVVQPFKLQGGMYRPVPPRGTATISLKAPGDIPKLHAKMLLPRYASHYDWLLFLGGGGAGGSGESFIRQYYGGTPGGPHGPSPNLNPPLPPAWAIQPGNPPGLPVVPLMPPGGNLQAGPHRPFGVGGGPGGGGGGGGGKDNMGDITLNLRCNSNPNGCGQDIAACKCAPHLWTMHEVMGIIVPAFPGACDFAWFGLHGDNAPCHTKTVIGIVRVSFWGQNFQLHQRFFKVAVDFGPCIGKLDPPGGGAGKPPPGKPPGAPGDPEKEKKPEKEKLPPEGPPVESKDRFHPRGTSQPTTPMSAGGESGSILTPWSFPYNDPSFLVAGDPIARALALQGGIADVPVWAFNPTALSAVLSGENDLFTRAYYGSGQSSLASTLANVDSGPELDLVIQGVLSALTGGDPGGSPPPPIPGCGALGIEFLLAMFVRSALEKRSR